MKNRFALTLAAALLLLGAATGRGQQPLPDAAQAADTSKVLDGTTPPAHSREYTSENPLIYEGSWDLWPYTFLNVNGQPDGYSVDLVRLILDRLHIPYVIKLKAQPDVFNDLREGRSDLMLGIAAGFHDHYGHYGNTAITLFTQSVATPKGRPVPIHTFSDLAHHLVIVNAGSLAYHLMVNQGWGDHATVTTDIKESMMEVSTRQEGIILWNDLGLKWLVKRFQLDNIELTPVNMPHGEYKFMSNDTVLLARMDSIYSELYSSEAITPLQNKWFYPERTEKPIPAWGWYLLAAGALLLLAALTWLFNIVAKRRVRAVHQKSCELNNMMIRALHMGNYDITEYDINHDRMTNLYGRLLPSEGITLEEFISHIHPHEQQEFRRKMERLLNGRDRQFELNKRWRSFGPDGSWLYFQGHAMVELDANGQLIGLNNSMRQLCGIVDDAPETSHFWENTNLFDLPMLRSAYARGSNYDMQACMHMRYPEIGIDRYVSYEMRPLFNADVELVNYFCSTLDITDTRQHHLAMRQLHHQQDDISHQIRLVQNWLDFVRHRDSSAPATPANT